LKNSKEGDKIDQTSPISESEKNINQKMSKMEEMIKRERRMDGLMDYQWFSLFLDVRLPPKFKMLVLDKFDGIGCPKSHLKMYMRAL